MKKRFVLLFFIMASIFSNSTVAFTHPLLLKENWLLKSSAEVKETGEIISSPKFIPAGWYPITIPSTVLTALAKNGVYPDPYVGMNNMLIPDASDEFNEEYDLSQYSYLPGERNPWRDPYWHRTEFKLSAEYTGKYCWLNFKGINYRADVWLNGNKIANSDEMAGMFRRFKFNVREIVRVGENNYLVVKIYPVDDPGIPAPPQIKALGEFGPNGGAPPKTIGKNVTMECSAGWDWIPAVRDRNMGIWQDVYINATGPVDLQDPYIITHLPLPDTNQTSLNICVELVNVSKVSQAGVLKGIIREKNIKFEKKVEIQAGETKKITFSPKDYPQLIIKNPRLWWPNGYGEQNLNRLTLDFEIGEEISDTEKITFGIREITSEVPPGKGRVFSINGKKIFIKGGAWVPDMMLNRDKKRYADEVRLSAEANLNMIRLWGGGITPPDEFFEACDKYGLLVWHDFWVTGDCMKKDWGGNPDWPLDHDLFLKCAADTVRKIRNHPSLLVWTGGNEGYPPQDIYEPLRDEIVGKLDGTRPFLPSSGYSLPPWERQLHAGAYSGGPYGWVEPSAYYEMVKTKEDWTFKDEVGLPSVPPLASLKKFIPDLAESPSEKLFPLNDTWGYHDACSRHYNAYHLTIGNQYGPPSDVADYVRKAQLVNASNYRAIFEAVNHRMWEITSGVLLWKTNSAWPSVVWQIYDWYLRPNAGYYYTKKACEPLHIQLNLDDFTVSVINTQYKSEDNLLAAAEVYNFDLELIWENSQKINMGPSQFKKIFTIPPIDDLSPVYFVKLELRARNNNLISDNFYWLSAESPSDFTQLEELSPVELRVSSEIQEKDGENIVDLTIENPSRNLAFFVHPIITKGFEGEEVLPIFWEDNYFNLLPGEKKKVKASFSKKTLEGVTPVVKLTGWNISR